MTEQQKQFLAKVTGPAIESERRWDLPADITIAQAILESATKNGWGTSPLFTACNNPFGIKARQHSSGDLYVEFETTEYHGANGEPEKARFMQFASLSDAFSRHGSLFWSDRYAPVIEACKAFAPPYTLDSLRTIAQAIQDCGYSTDPHYSDKLLNLIREIDPVLKPADTGANA